MIGYYFIFVYAGRKIFISSLNHPGCREILVGLTRVHMSFIKDCGTTYHSYYHLKSCCYRSQDVGGIKRDCQGLGCSHGRGKKDSCLLLRYHNSIGAAVDDGYLGNDFHL